MSSNLVEIFGIKNFLSQKTEDKGAIFDFWDAIPSTHHLVKGITFRECVLVFPFWN